MEVQSIKEFKKGIMGEEINAYLVLSQYIKNAL
jgi:hypothetical protein